MALQEINFQYCLLINTSVITGEKTVVGILLYKTDSIRTFAVVRMPDVLDCKLQFHVGVKSR
jgi:hypothetical protein